MSFPKRLVPLAGLVTWIAAALLPVAAAPAPSSPAGPPRAAGWWRRRPSTRSSSAGRRRRSAAGSPSSDAAIDRCARHRCRRRWWPSTLRPARFWPTSAATPTPAAAARWCGFKPTAARLRRSGLEMPEKPPPSFALGAVETTPLELARAYTVFAAGGRAVEPRPVERFERPQGRKVERFSARGRRVASEESAYLVRDLMVSAASEGTARNAGLPGVEVAAKTGSTSDLRDAWLAGEAGGLVAVVWVGRDDSKPLGLTGSAAAAPLWKRFMERAVRTRTPRDVPRPDGIVTRFFDPRTGLLVRQGHRRARPEIFRRGALPRRARFWRADPAMPVVR